MGKQFDKNTNRKNPPAIIEDHIEWVKEEKPWASNPSWINEKGQQSSIEFHYLYRTALRLGKGNSANLGVLTGDSTRAIAYGAFPNGGHVYGVDMFTGRAITKREITPDMIVERFKEIGLGETVTICKGLTSEWAEKLSHLKFKFIFVDAGHRYVNVKEDFELWSPLLEEGGEIAFHDVDMDNVDAVCSEVLDEGWELVEHVWKIKSFKRNG